MFDRIPDIDHEPQGASPTAVICDNLELFGGSPAADEPDTRDVWDQDEALAAIDEAFSLLADVVAQDGTQLEAERESLLWGYVNALHAQMQRLDRSVDDLKPKLRELDRAQDGTEITAHELERVTDRARSLGDRRRCFRADARPGRSRLRRRHRQPLEAASRIAHEPDRRADLRRHRRPRLRPRPR